MCRSCCTVLVHFRYVSNRVTRAYAPCTNPEKYARVGGCHHMDEFRIAGSTTGESEERTLSQVAQIAGYTSTLRELVRDSFGFCNVHGTPIPKSDRGRAHARCDVKPVGRGPGPRAGLR